MREMKAGEIQMGWRSVEHPAFHDSICGICRFVGYTTILKSTHREMCLLYLCVKMEVRWKTRLKEAGLYDWGQWQGRVKMIGVVEASIEIDGTMRGSLVPLVASLGNGCTFLRIKIILHKTTCFFCTNFTLRHRVCRFETVFPCTENIPMTDDSNFHAGIEAANIGGG